MAKLSARGATVDRRVRHPEAGSEYVQRSDGAILTEMRGGSWHQFYGPKQGREFGSRVFGLLAAAGYQDVPKDGR